jgi:hypothetical protein
MSTAWSPRGEGPCCASGGSSGSILRISLGGSNVPARPHRRVPEPLHQLLGRCPGLSRKRPGVVPEVVEVHAFQAGRPGRPAPDERPPAPVHRQAFFAREHESTGLRADVPRCWSSIAARVAGITTTRLPAAVLGASLSRSALPFRRLPCYFTRAV